MNRENITELVAKYEESHAVEEYTAYGWHVWPALRNLASWTLYTQDQTRDKPPVVHNKLAGNMKKLIHRTRHTLGLGLTLLRVSGSNCYCKLSPASESCDIAILTYDNRVQSKHGFFYHYVVDPLVEMIRQQGVSCIVWELGSNTKLPRFVQHVFCGSSFIRERRLEAFLSRLKPTSASPEWFEEYAQWWRSNIGTPLSWNDVGHHLEEIEASSRVFEKWLNKSGCSALIVDCWYDSRSMGAILAASRLGLWSMDFQHGLQGPGHFAYCSWTKAPTGGYEVRPDRFWVWGKDDAEALLKFNEGTLLEKNVIIGGNLWMNKWKNGRDDDIAADIKKARELVTPYKKAILVTLQLGIEYKKDLFPAIQNSPPEWLWLIRLHRQQLSQMNIIEAEFSTLTHSAIILRQATNLPLYAMFTACDCHVTWYSTCAVEALAFGVPSVILHPSGLHAFKRYIEDGVMYYCNESREIMESLKLCEASSAEDCYKVAGTAFASPEESRIAIEKLIIWSDNRHY